MDEARDVPDTPEWRPTSSLSGGLASATNSRCVSLIVFILFLNDMPCVRDLEPSLLFCDVWSLRMAARQTVSPYLNEHRILGIAVTLPIVHACKILSSRFDTSAYSLSF